MLGFLLYLNSIAILPYAFVFVIAIWCITKRQKSIRLSVKKNNSYLIVFVFFLFCCTFNTLIHGGKGIPNMYMQVLTMIAAFSLGKKDLKVFVLLTCAECFIGFYEYINGISSILPDTENAFKEDEDMLYFKRVNGLSAGCSSFSIKITICLLIISEYSDLFFKKNYLLYIPFFSGLFFSYNRTAIIVVFLYFLYVLSSNRKVLFNRHKIFILFIFVFTVVAVALFGTTIANQMTRGGGDTSTVLSGRPLIWGMFGEFIYNNLLLGNGSVHLLVPYYSGPIHAHNSFIQLIADHGIIISSLYLLNVVLRINKRSIRLCWPLIVLSCTQYVLFWGYTATDVFFFAFLLNPNLALPKKECFQLSTAIKNRSFVLKGE